MKADVPARFGPYEIIAPLGAGGMGQVYRARDPRLQRDVALKILSESTASSADRHRRFAQEAIAASALNHPNIVSVFDVGVENGTPYLVSELIDGTSVREELDRGRLPLKRVLEIAAQIADGLAAAHEAGIVHRDLKPDNVMIARGRVKILDFGLAKTTAPDASEIMAPSAHTQTATGLIVGTVPYMSPEQARGDRVDFRSDQFSFGVMLYEMLTGAHPFRRDTPVQTLSAIIGDEPAFAALAAPLPGPLRWIVERLLAKEPADRYAHTADLAADLRTIRDRLPEVSAVDVRAPVASRVRWLRRAVIAAAIAAAFVLGATVLPLDSDGMLRSKFTPFATDAGYQGAPAWSPDGKTLAYVADVDGVLQVFTKTRLSSRRVKMTSQRFDCHDPFWSPDASGIYYHSLAGARESLWRVSVAGGQPELVREGAARAAISPDGQTLAMLIDATGSGVNMTLWLAAPPDAAPKQQKMPFPQFADGVLRFSPDGTTLLMWLMRAAEARVEVAALNTGFWLMSPIGSDMRPVLAPLLGPRSPAFFSWMPDSRHIVVVRNDGTTPGSHLWLADLDTETLSPLTVTNGNEGSADVTPDGRQIAFTSEATDFDLVLLPTDGGPPRPLLSSTRNELDPSWSPVAPEYAFVTDQSGRPEIWLRNEDGSFDTRIVSDADFGGSTTIAFGSLAFSPDGQRIAYQRFSTDEGYRIFISPRSGGAPVRLSGSERYQDAPTWSPDGNWIAYHLGTPDQALAKVAVGARSAAPEILQPDVMAFTRPQWSPDNRWILFQNDEGLNVIAPDGKGLRTLSADEWIALAWSADTKRIYGLRRTDDLHHFLLASIDPATGAEQVVNANVGAVPQANQPIRGLSRGRGGLVTSIARARSDIWLLEGFPPPASGWRRFWRRPGW